MNLMDGMWLVGGVELRDDEARSWSGDVDFHIVVNRWWDVGWSSKPRKYEKMPNVRQISRSKKNTNRPAKSWRSDQERFLLLFASDFLYSWKQKLLKSFFWLFQRSSRLLKTIPRLGEPKPTNKNLKAPNSTQTLHVWITIWLHERWKSAARFKAKCR